MKHFAVLGWIAWCGALSSCASDGEPSRGVGGGGAGGAGAAAGGAAGREPEPPAGATSVPRGEAGNAGNAGEAGSDLGAGAGGAAPETAFTGAEPYLFVEVEAAKGRCGVDPTGQPCLSCHNILHETPFFVGGTVYLDALKSAPAVAAEVRVTSRSDGAVYLAHTDADGNFWLPRPAGLTQGPYLLGVRDQTQEQTMPLEQPLLDCNARACHGMTFEPVHLTSRR